MATVETVLLVPKNADGTAKAIPTVSPSLMPFHIAYSGPAPISTYFMPRPFVDEQEESRKRLMASGGGGKEEEHDGQSSVLLKEEGVAGPSGSFSSSSKVVEEVGSKYFRGGTREENGGGEGEEQQFVAAFRGRRVISRNVRVPEGYVGVLLTHDGGVASASSHPPAGVGDVVDQKQQQEVVRSESPRKAKAAAAAKARERAKALKAKAAAKLKAKGKATRRSKRNAQDGDEEEIDELEDDGNDDGDDEEEGDGDGEREGAGLDVTEVDVQRTKPAMEDAAPPAEKKVFQVKASFDTFKLWHQDVPVNPGQDEYIRSLNEWISLAAEIHKI
ncbi:hypothetical protein FRC17_009265 [Serendipita sp. 399]|nr:hypothetical protein FRC17_009265 [Serendipita sp. 399]